MQNRRKFLGTLTAGGALSFAGPVPRSLAQIAEHGTSSGCEHALVVIFLRGGNDGLNTVIPANDPLYKQYRKRTRISANRALTLGDDLFLHPSLRGLADAWENDRLAIVQAAGYPNHNRSHFVSTAVWHSGDVTARQEQGHGWLGKSLDELQLATDAPLAYSVGTRDTPLLLRGRHTRTAVPPDISHPEAKAISELLGADAFGSSSDLASSIGTRRQSAALAIDQLLKSTKSRTTKFPPTELGEQLEKVAWLVEAKNPARVYFLEQSGYDTHASQSANHAALLRELGEAVGKFSQRMDQTGNQTRVTTMIFSEFGRRLQENTSGGTDHGKGGPVFLIGGAVQPGFHGKTPRLDKHDDGDIAVTTDFRSIYRALAERCADFDDSFGKSVSPLALFRKKM